jgi:hypothetical protein
MKYLLLIVGCLFVGIEAGAEMFEARCPRSANEFRRVVLTFSGRQDSGNSAPYLTADQAEGTVSGMAYYSSVTYSQIKITHETFTIPGRESARAELRFTHRQGKVTIHFFDGINDLDCVSDDRLPVLKRTEFTH